MMEAKRQPKLRELEKKIQLTGRRADLLVSARKDLT
jgi:hypothetical protein